MKRIDIAEYGIPNEVAQCVDVEDVGAPNDDEVVFEVLAFPINPADLGFCHGTYRLRPPLPATPGAECVGRVTEVGNEVTHVSPGDLVINLQRENWAQKRRVSGQDAIKIPSDIDLKQAAMLRINPPTAFLMLSDIVALHPGDWIIQNVANSAVGRLVIRLAKKKALRTINITRRRDVFHDLNALGADVCLEDGPDLADRVQEATNNAQVRLGLDAIAGDAASRVAACLSDDATLCIYGGLSGKNPNIAAGDAINRGINMTRFILGRFMGKKTTQQIHDIYSNLANELLEGHLHAHIDTIYPIEDIQQALKHAMAAGRHGKILVTPNGTI